MFKNPQTEVCATENGGAGPSTDPRGIAT